MEDTYLDNDGDCVETEQDAFEDAIIDDKRRAEIALQYSALEKAWAAAEAGDPLGMLSAIHESKYLDGLFRVLRTMDRFDQLPDSEIELAIAEGVESFYAKVTAGVKILNLPAYLWKTVQNSALARFRKKQVREMSTEPADMEDNFSPLYEGAAPPIPGRENGESNRNIDPDQRRKAMLGFAMKTLPRLGQDNIQKVMGSVLAAVERGEVHWPPSAIAAETGLKPNTVSVLLRRGFERISREATKEGLQDRDKAKQFIETFNKD